MKLTLINEKRWNRMRAIKSFSTIHDTGEPLSEFIPVDSDARDKMYYKYLKEGVKLPEYSRFIRKNLRKEDLRVLREDWFITFCYKGKGYAIDFKKGFVWDGASVPLVLRVGSVTAHNNLVSKAAPVHDALFALHLLSYEDSNNVFSGLLREKNIKKFALGRFMFGVRSPVGRILYRKSNPDTSWMKSFVTFEEEV